MLVKSSAESIELAFNTAEYCCKKLFKSEEGGRYNKWYCYGVEFGQDYAWFKVEHTDYSVRLSFEFMDTGFVYVDGYFTNGSSYDKKTITSWKFDSESGDATADKVKDVLDRFFDEGINVLRGEEVMNSRRPIKSGTSIKEYAGFKIDDSVKINSPKRGPYKNGKTGIVVGFYKRYDGEILISVQLDEGGLMDFSKDELENLGDSGYHITYLDSSRKPVKSANRTWVAGKTENNSKLFYCTDGKFYAEEDYSRPGIKIFKDKDSAEKIAKRSKSGFVQVLDDYDD